MCVIAMPPKEMNPWWRGKRGFEVGTCFRLESATSVESRISAWSCSACTGWHGCPVSMSEDFPFGSGLGLMSICLFVLVTGWKFPL